MANQNLPSAWGNRNTSAKPNWGSANKEQNEKEKTAYQQSDEEKYTYLPNESPETITDIPKDELPKSSEIIPTGNETAKIENDVKAIEIANNIHKNAKTIPAKEISIPAKSKKKSNVTGIILILVFVLVDIVIIVFAVSLLSKSKKSSKSGTDNNSTAISEITTQDDVTTKETTTITEITTENDTETLTTEMYIYDYSGFWHPTNDGETELTIHSMNSSTVIFSLWYYRIYSWESITATFDGESAYFSNDEIEGFLTFYDGQYIVLNITMSTITGVPSQIEEVFDIRIDESAQYGNGRDYFNNNSSFKPYTIQISNPCLLVYDSPSYYGNVVGEITDKGKYTIVEEYYEGGQTTTEYWGKLKSGAGWINLYEAASSDVFYEEATSTDVNYEEETTQYENTQQNENIVYDSSPNWSDYMGKWSSNKLMHTHGNNTCYDAVLSLELYDDASIYYKLDMCNGHALYEVSHGKLYSDGDGTYSGSDYFDQNIIELGIYNGNVHLIVTYAYNIFHYGDALFDLKLE